MRRLLGTWGVLVVLVASPLAHGQDRGMNRAPYAPVGKCCYHGRTVVLVAGPACDNIDVKERLDSAFDDVANPPVVRQIDWITNDTSAANYRNQGAQMAGALKMAQEVQRVHQCSPKSAVVLLGFSAGARVVLLAAEQLPPCSVDRIILLAPAVSACYDVRGALRATRCGIDVFYNSEDTVLEVKESEQGTCDGMKCATAGRYSFTITKSRLAASDPSMAKVRQYDIAKCELPGGHYATLGGRFLRSYVLPMMTACPMPAPPPAPPAPPYVPPSVPPYSPPPVPPGPTYSPPPALPGPTYGPPTTPKTRGRTQGPTLPPVVPSPSTQPRLPPPPAPGPLPPPTFNLNPAAPPILPPPVVQPPM